MATFIIEPGGPSFFGNRTGDDRYVFNPANITGDRRIIINDTTGTNTIFLDGGLSIASSAVATNTNGTNALQLTLSNGAIISIGNANNFRYQTGGEGTNGQGGRTQDFNTFVTSSLGANVPAPGGTSSGGPVVVNESGGTNAGGGGNTQTVSVSPLQAAFDEGQTAFFNVSAPGVADGTTFTYQITGTVNGADFTNNTLSGTGTITNGVGSIALPLANDATTEGTERITVTVNVPGRNSATAGVDVNDTSRGAQNFTLTTSSANPRTVTEGDSGTQIQSYTFNISPSPTSSVTFNVAVLSGGTAVAGSDFNLLQNTITFAPNQTTQTLNLVEIRGDIDPEQTEQFTLQVTGALTSPLNLNVTIQDNDVGNTFALTAGADTVNGNANPDVINGAVSLFGSTFSNVDKIDGGGGRDTLNLSLAADFGTGLSPAFAANPGANGGFVNNVETLALTNGLTGTRTFDASNIRGVDTVTWNASTNGSLNLNGLGATLQNLAITNLAGGGFVALNHVSPVVDTPTDSLNLEITGVGTQSTATAAASPVTITSTGVTYENVNITANGNNALNLSATNSVATQSVTLRGSGTLELTGVSANLRSFDGSQSQGAISVTLDTNNATLATINGGSANDTITINGTDLQANAALNGGGGSNDRFVFNTLTDNNLVPSIVGFETLEFKSITGTNAILAVSGSRDVNTVLLSGTGAGNLTLQNLFDATGLTVVANGVSNATVFSANNVGNATFRTVAATAATAAAPTVVTSAVTFTEATGTGALEVAANTRFGDATTGEVNFSKASAVSINATGALGVSGGAGAALAVTANEANSVTFASTASPNGLTPALVDYLNLSAVKAKTVNLTANRALELVGSSLTGAENLTVNTTHGVNGTGVNLANAIGVTLSGASAASGVVLGNIGRADQTSAVSVTASGLQAGLTLGAVNSMESVSLNLSGVAGAVAVGDVGNAVTKSISVQLSNRTAGAALGVLNADTVTVNAANSAGLLTIGAVGTDIFVKDQLNYTGSGVTASSFDVEAKAGSTVLNALLNTGLAGDAITIKGVAAQTSIVVTGNLGAGTNTLTVNGTASTVAAGQSINIGNLMGVSSSVLMGGSMADTIIGSSGNDVITGGAGVDDMTGGAAADRFVFATADIDTTAGAVTDIIRDFSGIGGQVDVIQGSFGAATGTNYLEAGATVANLAALLTAADTALNGTVKYYLGQVTGGDAYLVTDDDGTGYTEVIQLVGVTLATFQQGDVVA